MLRSIAIKSLPVLGALAILLGAASSSFAFDHGHASSFHSGSYHGSCGGVVGGLGYNYNQGCIGYPSSFGHSQYPTWHNTSHYDYHPGGFQWHGNHFDYVPGHYDLHQTGHFHW